jgi:hypothetical protein
MQQLRVPCHSATLLVMCKVSSDAHQLGRVRSLTVADGAAQETVLKAGEPGSLEDIIDSKACNANKVVSRCMMLPHARQVTHQYRECQLP